MPTARFCALAGAEKWRLPRESAINVLAGGARRDISALIFAVGWSERRRRHIVQASGAGICLLSVGFGFVGEKYERYRNAP
jgi:hypothetical protein